MPDVCINKPISEDYFNEVPPLVTVEIRSDSQSKTAQRRKALAYIDNGVKISILVFPGENTEVYRADHAVKVLSNGGTLDGEDLLPSFGVAVDEIL